MPFSESAKPPSVSTCRRSVSGASYILLLTSLIIGNIVYFVCFIIIYTIFNINIKDYLGVVDDVSFSIDTEE